MNPALAVAWVVAFVLIAVTVSGLVRRIGWSPPVVLVGVGAALSFVPGIPRVQLEPEVVLYGVLPPLLFAAAFGTSVIDVGTRRETIALLSVGLVVFSAFAVGWVTYLLLPTVGLAAAFAFAAVVAPTDASAVTATAERLHLPHRVVTVLEGESLLNDATALVVLNTAIAAIVSFIGGWSIAGDLTLAVVGGIGVGLVVGWLMAATRSRLPSSVLDTSLALITPYLAFIAADAVHGSGVLAVVVSALYLGFRSPVAWLAMNEQIIARVSTVLLGATMFMLLIQIALIPTYRRLHFTLGFWSFIFAMASVCSQAIILSGIAR